jgi:hypothetical protein
MRAVVRGWMWVGGPKGGRDGERRIAGLRQEYFDGRESQELDRNPLGWPYSWPQHCHFSPTSITATTIKCFLGHARCQSLLCLPINFLRPKSAGSLEPGPPNSRVVGVAVAASHPSAFALGAGSPYRQVHSRNLTPSHNNHFR